MLDLFLSSFKYPRSPEIHIKKLLMPHMTCPHLISPIAVGKVLWKLRITWQHSTWSTEVQSFFLLSTLWAFLSCQSHLAHAKPSWKCQGVNASPDVVEDTIAGVRECPGSQSFTIRGSGSTEETPALHPHLKSFVCQMGSYGRHSEITSGAPRRIEPILPIMHSGLGFPSFPVLFSLALLFLHSLTYDHLQINHLEPSPRLRLWFQGNSNRLTGFKNLKGVS